MDHVEKRIVEIIKEALITYPVLQTHPDVPAAMKEHLGITETLLRLSVGLENVEDILKDLGQALSL